MLNKNIVEVIGKEKFAAHKYGLKKDIRYREGTKCRSRMIGKTKARLKNILSKRKHSTKELEIKTKININTLRKMLYELENKNEIKRVGKIVYKTKPCFMWKSNSSRNH